MKQYTNSIRDLIVITVFFVLSLDLIIGVIHVIAQQIQKYMLARLLYKLVAN